MALVDGWRAAAAERAKAAVNDTIGAWRSVYPGRYSPRRPRAWSPVEVHHEGQRTIVSTEWKGSKRTIFDSQPHVIQFNYPTGWLGRSDRTALLIRNGKTGEQHISFADDGDVTVRRLKELRRAAKTLRPVTEVLFNSMLRQAGML
ncbi:MAG TPA: hypothetical protein VLF20_02995 [Patescibacteria group bacterium]|nr:hypothetical protein [Patescibacteria group bacterium]